MESTSSFNEDMPVDKILDAELAVEPKTEIYTENSPGNSVRHIDLFKYSLHSTNMLTWAFFDKVTTEILSLIVPIFPLFSSGLLLQTNDPVTNICHAADKQLFTLVEWAKRIPHFSDLPLDDQVILLRAGMWHSYTHIQTMQYW